MKLRRLIICVLCAAAICPFAAAGTKEDDARAARALVEAGASAVDQWAQVRLSAASIRTQGRHAAEMSTQAIMGMPVRVIEKGNWWHIQTPDGYTGWIPSSSVVEKTPEEMAAWRKADRFVVVSPFQINVSVAPGEIKKGTDVVSDLVNGCIVESGGEAAGGYQPVVLPDGRKGYVSASAVEKIEIWAGQDFNPDKIINMASSMMGITYLWGGTTTKALDCSGLAKVSYFDNGRILMRDASQQAVTGTRIEAKDWRKCRKGDLLFFGDADTRRVTHVAIYDHDGEYVHSSGRVKRNSVDPKADGYLTTPFLHAVRIAGNEGTPGITRVIDHPWYF